MKPASPPTRILRFFRWFCREELCEAIEGDLIIHYDVRSKRMSRFRNNCLLLLQVLSFFQPFALRKEKFNPLANSSIMFINHFKIGFRIMRRYLTYSIINITGLAIGLSAVILISLFLKHELTYDRFHSKGQNIVRLTYRLETPNATREGAKLPFPVKEVLQTNYPEVQTTARFYYWGGDTPLLEYGNHKHTEEGVYFAENDVFKIFDFEFISGDPHTCLTDPRSIVLTESLAKKYFGSKDPMGQVMRYKNEDDLIVTGVMKDIPDNSHIIFDVLLPIELQRQRWMGWGKYTYDLEKDWNWAAAWVYTHLAPNAELDNFKDKVQAIANEYLNTEEQDGFSIEVQPLFDIHLKSDKSSEARANGNLTQVYAFGAVAILILIIACINFINLNAAQSNQRLKEVGVRKIMGAVKPHLVSQFMTESFLLVVISCFVAIAIAYATLPIFNEFMGTAFEITPDNSVIIIVAMAGAIFVALLSGLRPSLAVIRINAVQRFSQIRSSHRFSKTMIVGQFVVCNLLFIGILIINDQLSFLQNKDLGFDKDEILVLRHGRNLSKDQFEIFENELKAIPSVQTLHRGYIAGTSSYTNTFKIVGSDDNDTYSLGIKWVGEGFTEMFHLELILGRLFDPEVSSDVKNGVLINAAAAKALGWNPEESIDQKLSFLPGGASEPEEIRILGVLADANFESLYDPVLPSVFRMTQSPVGSPVSLKLSHTNELIKTIEQLEKAWDTAIPEWPFEFSFLDQNIQEQYIKEEKLASAIRYFALLAIFIACSGLFGLSTFAVLQKTKEIGIRKVMGASLQSIFLLVSQRFLWLIAIAFIFSIPVGYYLGEQWLQDFAYRIEIGPMVFITAGVASMVMVIIAVGSQSLKAAKTDPINTLRYE